MDIKSINRSIKKSINPEITWEMEREEEKKKDHLRVGTMMMGDAVGGTIGDQNERHGRGGGRG